MKITNEAMEHIRRTVENKDVETHGELDMHMKIAYEEDVRADRHIQAVKKELDDRAKSVTTESPDTGAKLPENMFTKQYKLDENIEDFKIEDVKR